MTKRTKTQYADVASWELSDSVWERIAPLLSKPKSRFRGRGRKRRDMGGRPSANPRQLMSAILYILRTGCQWTALPKKHFGVSGKTANRYYQRWVRAGVFKRMWQAGLEEFYEVKGILWKWQSADGAITKAPLGGKKTGKNPTDRGKIGTKRSLLVNEQGLPLGLVVSGANTPDSKLLANTLLAIPIERPDPSEVEQHLSLDKGYSGAPLPPRSKAISFTYLIKPMPKKRKRKPGRRKPRRWIVEVVHSWINRFRRLLVRWEKKDANYLSLLYFACAIICWRKCEV